MSDVIIVGAGLTGLAMANSLIDQGLSVTIVDRQQPTSWCSENYALRVSAISLASQQLFENLDVWSQMQAKRVSPYQSMKVWDAVSNAHIEFDAAEMSSPHLGHIIENDVMIDALWERLPKEVFVLGQCQSLQYENNRWTLVLAEQTLQAPLVIACDGACSWVRETVGIEADRTHYDQKAIVAVVKSAKSHEATAYQRFLPSGPLAFLPLGESHLSSIVWSLQSDLADEYLEKSEAEFNELLGQALEERLGETQLHTERVAFPLIHHHAKKYVQDGLVLVGDAAHAIHPLAGQGVNLGFADVACLSKIIRTARDKGRRYFSLQNLEKYERARRADNSIMHQSMTGFNALFSNEKPTLVGLRSAGLAMVNSQSWLKGWLAKRAVM